MRTKFALRLGELRKEQSLNQKQVASELGISQAMLSHYENNLREPKLEFVLKVCTYYNVTADYILGRTDERVDGATKLCENISDKLATLNEIRQQENLLLDGLMNTLLKSGVACSK